jgi:hypothetical protein
VGERELHPQALFLDASLRWHDTTQAVPVEYNTYEKSEANNKLRSKNLLRWASPITNFFSGDSATNRVVHFIREDA